MFRRTIILAAGGSGGHVFPALALSESLILRGWTVFFVTDQRGITFASEFPEQVKKVVIDFPNPWSAKKISYFKSIWFFLKSLVKIIIIFRKVRAVSIIGFGGYPSAASMLAGFIMRIPSAIHEQNSVLGRVNKIFSSRVNLIVFGIKPIIKPCVKVKTRILGNPVRRSILEVIPKKYSQLNSDVFVILALGGSQGASFVSSIVCDTIVSLPKGIRNKIRIVHQCRKEDVIGVQEKYDRYNINSLVKIFFDDISNHLNSANLIISRSGASSLAEFCIFGRPSILIPLPSAVGNHQVKNACVMEEAGASLVFNQENMSTKSLGDKILYLLKNFTIANKMSLSAKKLAKPDAADSLADELEQLI